MSSRLMPRLTAIVVVAWVALAVAGETSDAVRIGLGLGDDEVRRILQHGPWPAAWSRDPSNRVSGHTDAIALGERLFFDLRLSVNGTVACASCHAPERGWTDGRARAAGLAPVDRNTPGLANVRLNRWFGWDGAGDSLWAQSIRPLLDSREMGASARHVADVVRADGDLACRYAKAFGAPPSPSDAEVVLVNVAKALAAFQETISSARTAFDEFRDALARRDLDAAARYPLAARRGLKLFVGRGACSVCHVGAHFTNGEFHDVGIPFFVGPSTVDPGRHDGIRRLQASRFNLLGPFSDDPSRATAVGTRHVAAVHRNWGEFKVPSLRDVARTAPYMHNGSLATLRDVVRHYSEIDENRLHADGERLLQPLRLSEQEFDDLIAFLESLTAPTPTPRLPTPSAAAPCFSPTWGRALRPASRRPGESEGGVAPFARTVSGAPRRGKTSRSSPSPARCRWPARRRARAPGA